LRKTHLSEPAVTGSNINLIKAHNVRAVLLNMLNHETSYRVQIARQTALSTTTITNIIDELIEQGIVSEYGAEEVDGRRRVGRPRAAIHLVHNARYAIGVQMAVKSYRVGLANLKAEIQHCQSFPIHPDSTPEDVLSGISEQVRDLIATHQIQRDQILGVGVGATGLVNYKTGVNILSPNLGWENVPIQETLVGQLDLPVVVDNNVKAMALGEAFFGSGKKASSLAFVYGRTGVGSGIVMNNQLLRGANLGAGEIGHMIIKTDSKKQCRCGQYGCLETLVSETALVAEAIETARQNPHSLLASCLASEDLTPIQALLKAAREGDLFAQEMLTQAGYYLGIALANLVNLLNPEMIVLGGLFAQAEDIMLPVTRHTLEQKGFAGLGKEVKLQSSSFGWQAGIVGAAALALTAFFYLNPEDY
jgi:glucokinase-like ROK family protein